jgi:hypothetical protein
MSGVEVVDEYFRGSRFNFLLKSKDFLDCRFVWNVDDFQKAPTRFKFLVPPYNHHGYFSRYSQIC